MTLSRRRSCDRWPWDSEKVSETAAQVAQRFLTVPSGALITSASLSRVDVAVIISSISISESTRYPANGFVSAVHFAL
jgi:hypothetical protein